MAGLYKDFDEIELNCPDSIYGAIKYMKEEYDYMDPEDSYDKERAIDMYISTMGYMELGSLYDKSEMLEKQRSSFGLSKGDSLLTKELPKEYDRQQEAMCLSSALHLVHQKFPEAHEQAIDCLSYLKHDLAHEKGLDIDRDEDYVYFNVPEHITGKDAFPDYLDKLIEEKLDGIRDDLYIEKNVTWTNSHLDNGYDYDYSEDESPYVIIRSFNPQSLDMAVNRLENITDKEILDKKEEIERQQKEEYDRQTEQKIKEYASHKPEPYFENKFCSCYKEQDLPKDLSPYTINPDKDGFTSIFTISTPETNMIYLNDKDFSYYDRKELLPNSDYLQKIGDTMAKHEKDNHYLYSYEEIKDSKEFAEKLDKCMDMIIERTYDKEHEIALEHDKDIEVFH